MTFAGRERRVDVNISLLDVIQGWARCVFLSDLHDLSDEQCVALKRTIIRLPSEAAALTEWNEAIAYLSGRPSDEMTSEQAKAKLIDYLTNRASHYEAVP